MKDSCLETEAQTQLERFVSDLGGGAKPLDIYLHCWHRARRSENQFLRAPTAKVGREPMIDDKLSRARWSSLAVPVQVHQKMEHASLNVTSEKIPRAEVRCDQKKTFDV